MTTNGEKALENEDDHEEWCFVCKNGGDMIICEHKDCLKSYHPECVALDDSYAKSENRFFCALHSCEMCMRASDYQCYCCPASFCGRCIKSADFVVVRRKKGFSGDCLKLALLVEEKKDVDSEGETVDFNNRNTYETLYKEYWEIINGTEKFTLDDLLSAKEKLKFRQDNEKKAHGSGKNLKRSKPESLEKKVKKEDKKKLNNEGLDGCGSTRFIEFLKHIGKDTSNALSQRYLKTIVKRYSVGKGLMGKNKIVKCDEWLQNRIYYCLETHLAENQASLSSDDNDELKTPTQTSRVGTSSCHRVQPLLITGTGFYDTEDDASTSHQISEPNPNKRAKTSKALSINDDDLAVLMQKALHYLIKGNEGPTVRECSEKLKLVGLEPLDPLFLAAYHIFGVSSYMREAWMALPEIPDVLRGFIAMTARSLGLIKE